MNLPEGVILSDVSVNHNTPNFKTESLNLKEKVKDRGIHRLEGSCQLTIGGTVRSQKRYNSFLLKVKGSLNTFEIDLPRHFKSEELTANPTAISTVNIGSTEMTLSSFVGEIYEGSCFTVPNDTKIYYLLSDAESGDTVSFYPALNTKVLSGGTINFISPVITARFEEDSQPIEYSENGLILESELKWREAL